MAIPLSYQFNSEGQQVPGMFGGPRGRVAPRGAYTVMGVGDPNLGYNGSGFYWSTYPGLLGGQSGYQNVSTETGMPVGSVQTADTAKVGGGAAQAEIPDYGGTAAY